MSNREITWKPKESEELFRTLAETTSAVILILEGLRIRYANAAARIITGFEVEELLTMDFPALAAPAYREVLNAYGIANRWASDIPLRYEIKLARKDGSERWVDLTAGQTTFDGHPALVVTAFDISARDQAEQALRLVNRDAKQLDAIFEGINDAVVFYLPDGTVERANAAAARVYGFNPSGMQQREIVAQMDFRTLDGKPLPLEQIPSTRVLRGERVDSVSLIVRNADGAEAWVEVSGAPLYNGSELAGAVVVWHEISHNEAIRIAQEAGRLIEETTAAIQAIADPVLIFSRDEIIRRANPAALRAFGFDPVGMKRTAVNKRLQLRELGGQAPTFEELPFSRALLGEVVDGRGYRLINGQGNDAIYLASAAPIALNGEVTDVVVVWHDITEREHLLARLDAEERKLKAVIQYAPEAIVMVDPQGNLLLANPVARQLYGQSFPDQGGNLLELGIRFMAVDGNEILNDEMPILRAAREGISYSNLELRIELPGGQERMVLGNISPVFDAHHNPSGAVAVFQDITQLKHSEEATRRETARLELLSSLSQAIAEAGLYYPAVLSTIAERVAESIGDGCIIRLVSDDGIWLDPVAFHHTSPEAFSIYRSALHSTRKRVDEGYSGHVFKTGEPLIVLDMTQDELMSLDPAANGLFPVQNGLIVPLRAQNRFIGTLTVFRSHTRIPFSSEDQVFLQDLADRAALAIENARLYAAEAQRARELDALHKAASALLSTLDLDALLGQILDAAQNAIPTAEKGLLHLINPGTSELRVRAMLGYQNPRIQKINGAGGQDFLLQAVAERRALLVRDTQAGMEPSGSAVVRSAVVAPLIVENKVLGALSLSSSIPSAFSDADLRLLVSLAATTTAAIQNALLHSEVQRLAITDALTGLYNRRGFFDLGQRELERSQRFGRTLSAIMLDIDHFKQVNDSFGHSVGDQVLATLARRCRTNIRHVDILGRYGGEEFAILLPETDLFTASEIAERIRRSIADEPFLTDHELVKITISLGVTRALQETSDLKALLERADAALYRAKQGGRNRVEIA